MPSNLNEILSLSSASLGLTEIIEKRSMNFEYNLAMLYTFIASKARGQQESVKNYSEISKQKSEFEISTANVISDQLYLRLRRLSRMNHNHFQNYRCQTHVQTVYWYQ